MSASHVEIACDLLDQITNDASTCNKPTPKFLHDATMLVYQQIIMSTSQPTSLTQLSLQDRIPALPTITNACCESYDDVNDAQGEV